MGTLEFEKIFRMKIASVNKIYIENSLQRLTNSQRRKL